MQIHILMPFDLKLFENIPITFKTTFIFTASIMPFHFLAIYQFPNHVPINNIPLLVSLCYCLSITWLISNYSVIAITSFIFSQLTKIFTRINQPISFSDEIIITSGGLLSLLIISVSFLISYTCSLTFKQFISISYALILVRIIIDVIFGIKMSKINLPPENT
jgi:hypothetical protein